MGGTALSVAEVVAATENILQLEFLGSSPANVDPPPVDVPLRSSSGEAAGVLTLKPDASFPELQTQLESIYDG
eukprot:156608-Prymnesium_polylepis.1